MKFQLTLDNEAATVNFGSELAKLLQQVIQETDQSSILIFLNGELGAGKTSLVRACLRALGVDGPIKSPTYTLLEPYVVSLSVGKSLKIAHLDLYRLSEPEELDYIGGRDLAISFDLVFIEWANKGKGALPQADLIIQLNHIDKGRAIELDTHAPFIIKKFKSIQNK